MPEPRYYPTDRTDPLTGDRFWTLWDSLEYQNDGDRYDTQRAAEDTARLWNLQDLEARNL